LKREGKILGQTKEGSMTKIKIEYVNEGQIQPADYNPRHMGENELGMLTKGLNEFGLVEPLVINQDGTLIGGHQRLKAMKNLGWTEYPAVRLDIDKAKEKALNLALNKINGEWDYEKLSSLLKGFDELPEPFDMDLTGFDIIEATELTELTDVDPSDLFNEPDNDGMNDMDTKPKQGMVIQYNVIFNNEDEQKAWHGWLKELKSKYTDLETISERIIAEIQS